MLFHTAHYGDVTVNTFVSDDQNALTNLNEAGGLVKVIEGQDILVCDVSWGAVQKKLEEGPIPVDDPLHFWSQVYEAAFARGKTVIYANPFDDTNPSDAFERNGSQVAGNIGSVATGAAVASAVYVGVARRHSRRAVIGAGLGLVVSAAAASFDPTLAKKAVSMLDGFASSLTSGAKQFMEGEQNSAAGYMQAGTVEGMRELAAHDVLHGNVLYIAPNDMIEGTSGLAKVPANAKAVFAGNLNLGRQAGDHRYPAMREYRKVNGQVQTAIIPFDLRP